MGTGRDQVGLWIGEEFERLVREGYTPGLVRLSREFGEYHTEWDAARVAAVEADCVLFLIEFVPEVEDGVPTELMCQRGLEQALGELAFES